MADNKKSLLDQDGLDNYTDLIKNYVDNKIDSSLEEIADTLDKLVNGGLPDDSEMSNTEE